MKVLLFIALLLVLSHCSSQCVEKFCPNEMNNCGASEECVDVLMPCAEKCNWNPDVDLNGWNCMVFCAAPSKNPLAIAFVTCAKKNCPQKIFLMKNLLHQ